MNKWDEMGKFALAQGTSGMVLGGAAAAAVVAVTLYATGVMPPEPAPPPPAAQVVAEPDAPGAEAVSAPDNPARADAPERAAPEEPAVAAPERSAPETPTPAEAPAMVAPSFDVVRVSPDGQALVAGRAPGALDVAVLVDGQEASRAEVDGTGKFVAFLDLPSSDVARVISLASNGEADPITSEDEVIVAPTPQVPESPAELTTPETNTGVAALDIAPQAGDPSPDTGDRAALAAPISDTSEPARGDPAEAPANRDSVPEDAPTATLAAPGLTGPQAGTDPIDTPEVEDQVASADAPKQPAAPAVLLSTSEGVDVLQSGSGGAPDTLDQIALDAITYEAAGAVALDGRGVATEFVRVYLDNKPVQTTEINADGQWRATLPNVDSGTYTLRVDAVDASGAVTSRVESPFRREDPDVLAEATEAQGETVAKVVTVQPGHTLWAIARNRYGEGIAYVRVFDANRDRIRDPDLIYPGQVFSIPD